jgi:hypothetical protein
MAFGSTALSGPTASSASTKARNHRRRLLFHSEEESRVGAGELGRSLVDDSA